MKTYPGFRALVAAVVSLLMAACSYISPSAQASNAYGSVRSLKDIRYENTVIQGFDWSCGVASLATILREGFGDSITELQLIETINKTFTESEKEHSQSEGLTMKQLADAAISLNYDVIAKNLTSEEIAKIGLPAIIKIDHFDGPHFVVIKGVFTTPRMTYALIVYPASGNLRTPYYQLSQMWLGEKTRAPVLIIQRKDHLWKAGSSLLIN